MLDYYRKMYKNVALQEFNYSIPFKLGVIRWEICEPLLSREEEQEY